MEHQQVKRNDFTVTGIICDARLPANKCEAPLIVDNKWEQQSCAAQYVAG